MAERPAAEEAAKFRPPKWAAAPQCRAWLELREASQLTSPPTSVVRCDGGAVTTFGRAAESVDVHVDDAAASRLHAAIVHHENGSVYLIDTSSSGTQVDSLKCDKHRPLHLHSGYHIRFGAERARLVYTYVQEAGAPKRTAEAAPGEAAKRARPAAQDSVRARHLLVKHRDSRRPSSWKETTVTRSAEEALQLVLQFQQRLQAGESFEQLAAAESHCSSAKKGGDLGSFARGAMQKAFEDAAFALAVGQLSEPVHTDSGVHLILRTG
jgi:NIMA-interacting peptidyl-prolyl cis-trans isomerase 1